MLENFEKDTQSGIEYYIVPKERIKETASYLREQGYDYISFITAVDMKDSFWVVYHFKNLDERKDIFLKVVLPHDKPEIDSIVEIYPGADWLEREAYDLLGVVFKGHPNLERILLPQDYEGHPLRKDFPMHMEYEPYRTGDWLVNHENKPPAKRKS